MRPLIVAHRVESSKLFEAAIQAEADGIEFDVRQTGDRQLIVHHNEKVGRFSTRNHSLQQLQEEAHRRGYTIATLQETITKARGRFKCDIELKDTGYEEAALKLVMEHLPIDQFDILSFHDSSIAAIKEQFAAVRCGLLLGFWWKLLSSPGIEFFPIDRARGAKADFLAPHWVLLRFGFRERATNNQFPLRVWTVDSESRIEQYSRAGWIEAIITNMPGVAQQVVRRMT